MEKSRRKFKRYKDSAGNRYVKVYIDEDIIGGIDEIAITFDEDTRFVKEGKLYTYRRLEQERLSFYESGFADGYAYAQSLLDGLEDKESASSEKALDNNSVEKCREDVSGIVVSEAELKKAFEQGYQEALKTIVEQQKQEKIKKKSQGTVKGKEGRKPALTKGEHDEIKALHDMGMSYRKLAERYKVSHQTIVHVIKGRRDNKVIDQDKKAVAEMSVDEVFNEKE